MEMKDIIKAVQAIEKDGDYSKLFAILMILHNRTKHLAKDGE